MARTLSEIYASAKECRNKYLELTEFENSSKMSIIDAFTWVTSSCIWAFENILDVFKVDLANDLQNRVNGTPSYYANALMKYQSGDELEINEDGTSFRYPTIDESKRIVTRASYYESTEEGFHDKKLVLKIATGGPGNYSQIEYDELVKIRAYCNQIAFAGTNITVVSRKGDILIPRVTVYYDGSVTEDEVYSNIEQCLNEFIANLSFDGMVYFQRIIDAIQKAEHVVDVHIDKSSSGEQGIFLAQYDDDNTLIPASETGKYEHKIDRFIIPNSGYLKQSSSIGDESIFPTWKDSIILKIEEK
jgi:hypothetical protein